MGFFQAYKMAIKSIVSNKVRSLLTMLGVIIGVGSVIVAVAFAQGSTKSIMDQISSLGTNLIQVSIQGRGSNRNITYDDMKKFQQDNSADVQYIAPQVNGSVTVKVGLKSRDTSLNGTSPEFSNIKSTSVSSGRFLLSFDIDYMQKVAVIGTAVANDVFAGVSPVGQNIKINGQVFKVIGVLEEKAGGQDQSADDTVIIPYNVAQRMTKTGGVVRSYMIQAVSAETVDPTMTKLTDMYTKMYKDTRTFRIFNQAQMLSTLNSVTGTMTMVLAGIAAISLIVGGIGIMNIMLVSVTERTREIGIRKAIGAKRKNILIQFLIEAAMVTGIGGIMGILVGLAIIKFVIEGLKLTTAVYSLEWILLSFGISVVIGVIFGMFPANKAASLNPIEALRFE